MDTRLLRASERTTVGHARIFPKMGQMQPVIFGKERGRFTLRIEGSKGGRPCWMIYPFPACKAEAKAAFAELERCNREGIDSPATAAIKAKPVEYSHAYAAITGNNAPDAGKAS